MPSNSVMIHKLQTALNTKGLRLMYTTQQFYSETQDRPVTVYHIKQAVYDEGRGKFINQELFKSPSQLQIVKYLRDLWYSVNGWELPPDDEKWEAVRDRIMKGEL